MASELLVGKRVVLALEVRYSHQKIRFFWLQHARTFRGWTWLPKGFSRAPTGPVGARVPDVCLRRLDLFRFAPVHADDGLSAFSVVATVVMVLAGLAHFWHAASAIAVRAA